MTGVYVFLGPTLPAAAARAELDAEYLPPVSAGDVCRIGELRPRAIGIVDGCGEGGQAVWHKEILWAMERGVHVFGAAAIGALRAVELASFGMRGAGWVYRAFSDGTLDRDDEIAVAWEPGPGGYLNLSEAMVSIRRTLGAARDSGVIRAATHDTLVATGAATFYPGRTWPALLATATAAGADPAELDALRRWLPAGRIDQQAADAVAMLREMRAFLAAGLRPQRVAWTTAPTTRWDTLYRYVTSRPRSAMPERLADCPQPPEPPAHKRFVDGDSRDCCISR
ncbi:MAG TPA: TfuA-like protein [Streptosporangiaceae bacterium]